VGAQRNAAFAEALENARVKFIDDMDDDFNTAGALGAIFEIVKQGNAFLQTGVGSQSRLLLSQADDLLEELLGALGVEIAFEGTDQASGQSAVDFEVLLEERQQARAEKNWARADQIRDEIDALGYSIEDTAQGARVVRKS
ncbi:MAG: cysteine--tRNA ligase, partial [Coriobacteriia bacterium]|nr:cysteine--tRNA ligase [Coriobacteriia bacterium]